MIVVILGVSIGVFVAALLALLSALRTRRFRERILREFSTRYIHMPDGCTDPGCPCIQAYLSQKEAR